MGRGLDAGVNQHLAADHSPPGPDGSYWYCVCTRYDRRIVSRPIHAPLWAWVLVAVLIVFARRVPATAAPAIAIHARSAPFVLACPVLPDFDLACRAPHAFARARRPPVWGRIRMVNAHDDRPSMPFSPRQTKGGRVGRQWRDRLAAFAICSAPADNYRWQARRGVEDFPAIQKCRPADASSPHRGLHSYTSRSSSKRIETLSVPMRMGHGQCLKPIVPCPIRSKLSQIRTSSYYSNQVRGVIVSSPAVI